MPPAAPELGRSRPGSASAPDSAGTSDRDSTSSRFSVRNWRVRTRLSAILLIPVLVALVLGGFRVKESVTTLHDAEDARNTAKLVQAAATYSNALINERDHTAEPLLHGDKDAPLVARYRSATDRAKAAFDRAAAHMPDKPGLRRRLATFRKQEPKLSELRATAYGDRTSGVQTEEGYVDVQHPLMEFANELGFGTDSVASYGRTVYSVSLAKAGESLQRSIGAHLLTRPGPGKKETKRQLTAFGSYAYLERIAEEEYVGGGSPRNIRLLKHEMSAVQTGDKEHPAGAPESGRTESGRTARARPPMEAMVKAIGSGAPPSKLRNEGVTTDSWFTAATGKFDAYRATEKQLTSNAVRETGRIASGARRDAIVNGSATLAALALALAIAALMARSMSRSMHRLRTAALEVAGDRLPTLVERLSRTEPGRVDTRVGSIPIDSRDEIGEVARAFEQVHREAVRLAAEQAMLRGNVSAIFTNLSRRNTDMLERQLGLISELENRESEPDQLEILFRLDHLATRMRRNDENLLVLAGAEPGRQWNAPVPLVDILRAASSEVERYERIQVSGELPDSEIHGQVVGDLVHLLAELLENATSFSAPQTYVRAGATRLPDGRVLIEIHDRGIGLTQDDFADLNHKLDNPPTVDAAVSRRLGLFVVGRLADRHGIRVQLRPSGEHEGTTCLVMLPESITHGGGGAEEVAEDHLTPSRFFSERPGAQQPSQQPSQQQSPSTAGQQPQNAEAFGQALWREEHRAALEAEQARQPPRPAPDLPPDPASPQQSPQQPAQQPPQQRPRQSLEQPYGEYQQYQQPPYGQQYGTPQPPEAEAGTGIHEDAGDRVGFRRPGPSPGSHRSTTGAGLPRRERGGPRPGGGEGAHHPQHGPQPEFPYGQRPPAVPEPTEPTEEEWRSANDERWDRAGRLRTPEAGGVTQAGLPRRVPRANLVEGAAEQDPRAAGPLVSRHPEDVRGRLSNLHRGIRRGRSAGHAIQNDRQGYGPGSTYDQER